MTLSKEEAIKFWKEKIEQTSFFEAQKDFITLFDNLPKIIERDNSNPNNIYYYKFGSFLLRGEKIATVERRIDFMDLKNIYYRICFHSSLSKDEIFRFSNFDTAEIAMKTLEEYLESKCYELIYHKDL